MRLALVPWLVLFALLAVAVPAQTVVVNGQKTAVPMIEKDGKAFVDIAALAKLLGYQVVYDAAGKVLSLNTKPAPVPAPKSANSGIPQLPGAQAVLDQLYTLCKDGAFYFSLKSAEFTVAPVPFGVTSFIPTAEEKYLVLHFTMQNATNAEQNLNWATLHFTVVDANNNNNEYVQELGGELNHDKVNINLKPAQKVECYTAVKMPAKGVVPKLMVLPHDGSPVLRYDLHDKVKPLPAPIADPADPTGATARADVPAKVGETYPVGEFAVTVEKVAYQAACPLKGADGTAEAGNYLVITYTAKNITPAAIGLNWNTIRWTTRTTDDEEPDWSQELVLGTTDRNASYDGIKPGEQVRVRTYFALPADAKGKSLMMRQNENRSFTYTLTP